MMIKIAKISSNGYLFSCLKPGPNAMHGHFYRITPIFCFKAVPMVLPCWWEDWLYNRKRTAKEQSQGQGFILVIGARLSLWACLRMPFSLNSALRSKNYPRNINHMPVVIFFASLDFGKNCYSWTASYDSNGGFVKKAWHDTCGDKLRSKKRREDSERSRLSFKRLSYFSI